MSVWLKESEYHNISKYAEAKNPLESGGVLLGYRSGNDVDMVVTHVLGSGPKAIHGRFSYVPDYLSDEESVGEIFDNYNGEITYLGDWHSHPNQESYLSWRDRRALRNIARYKENYIDTPIMLILGGCKGAYKLNGWRIHRLSVGSLFCQWKYRQEEIIRY